MLRKWIGEPERRAMTVKTLLSVWATFVGKAEARRGIREAAMVVVNFILCDEYCSVMSVCCIIITR